MTTPGSPFQIEDCDATPSVARFFKSSLKYNNEHNSASRLHDYKHTWLVCVYSCTCGCGYCTFILVWLHMKVNACISECVYNRPGAESSSQNVVFFLHY